MKRIILAFLFIFSPAVLFADQPSPLFEQSFRSGKYTAITPESLASWQSQKWVIDAKEVPEGWAPTGENGVLKVITETDGQKYIRFNGRLSGPTIALPNSGLMVVSVTTRNGTLRVSGPMYGGPNGGMIGWFVLPAADSGAEWTTITQVYHGQLSSGSAAVLGLESTTGVDVADIRIVAAGSPMEAYRIAYPLIRKQMTNLVKNGGFENVRPLSPDEVNNWKAKKWDIGEGNTIYVPDGFGPHGSYEAKVMKVVNDASLCHSGSRCLEMTLATGGGFTAKAGRQYLFSVWACGEGSLELYCYAYGGPLGGWLGRKPVTRGDEWALTKEWQNYSATVPLTIEGYNEFFPNPVFSSSKVIRIDDFAVYELDTVEAMLSVVGKIRQKLEETLSNRVELGPQQTKMVQFLLSEAISLEKKLRSDTVSDETVNKVAALQYVVPGVKSEVEFGILKE